MVKQNLTGLAYWCNYLIYVYLFYILLYVKVKDMKDFEFDPASTVLDICRMYVELGDNERFCAAVSDDGRSYSPQLFTLAEAVLGKDKDKVISI